MLRFVPLLILVCVLPAANVSAACRSVGTQIECDLGANHVVLGTRAAAGPAPFHGTDRLADDRPIPNLPFKLELQDIATDPSLCWTTGHETFANETYCY